jgi:hypothetical protein
MASRIAAGHFFPMFKDSPDRLIECKSFHCVTPVSIARHAGHCPLTTIRTQFHQTRLFSLEHGMAGHQGAASLDHGACSEWFAATCTFEHLRLGNNPGSASPNRPAKTKAQ